MNGDLWKLSDCLSLEPHCCSCWRKPPSHSSRACVCSEAGSVQHLCESSARRACIGGKPTVVHTFWGKETMITAVRCTTGCVRRRVLIKTRRENWRPGPAGPPRGPPRLRVPIGTHRSTPEGTLSSLVVSAHRKFLGVRGNNARTTGVTVSAGGGQGPAGSLAER